MKEAPIHQVAPRAGAWIEIDGDKHLLKALESPLAQGRGLKFTYETFKRYDLSRPSRRGVD